MFRSKPSGGSLPILDGPEIVHLIPTPREVEKIRRMLGQVEVWINAGEHELVSKHWQLISDECLKLSTGQG